MSDSIIIAIVIVATSVTGYVAGFKSGRHKTLLQLMEVSKDPIALGITMGIMTKKFDSPKDIQKFVDDSINYYKQEHTNQKRDI